MASPIQYTKFDFESHRDAIKQRIAARWPTRWNDFLTSSFGSIIIDVIAWSTSLVSYSINAIAGELFIPTMRLRESAVRIGALTGYKLRGATPSTLRATATLSEALEYPVTIRKGAVVRAQNANQTVFEVTRDFVIAAGNLSPEALVATFDAALSGDATTDVQTNVRVATGYAFADLVDTSIDATQRVEVGQVFYVSSDPDTRYSVTGIVSAPGAISNNRILLDRPWEGASAVAQAVVVDTRITLLQGQTVVETVVAPTEDGCISWFFMIQRTNVIQGSVTLEFAGTAWSAVESLSLADADAQVFEVVPEVNGNYSIRCGDGRFGATVPAQASVRITYRTGGGVSGNIGPNQIRSSVTGYATAPYSATVVNVTNEFTAATGGQDAETLEQARAAIPRHTRTGGQCVTLIDYEVAATAFTGVARAKAVARREATVLEGNLVTVYAWTTGAGGGLTTAPAALRADLQAHLQAKAVATDYVLVDVGTVRPLPVAAKFAALGSTDPVTTRLVLEDVIASYSRGLSPGDPVVYSDLLRLMDEAPTVDSVALAVPATDVQVRGENEIFGLPYRNLFTALKLAGIPNNAYLGKLPYYPLASWAAQVRVNGVPASVVPDTEEGYARIVSSNVSTVYEGTSASRPEASVRYLNTFYQTTDSGEVYKCQKSGASYGWALQAATQAKSRINLRNGEVFIHTVGTLSSFEFSLVPVQGYTSVRSFDVYVAYTASAGENAVTRTRIRDAVIGAVEQTAPGGSVFSTRQTTASTSAFNLWNVVERTEGVRTCDRIALESATGTVGRIDANDYQQLRVRNVYVNGLAN